MCLASTHVQCHGALFLQTSTRDRRELFIITNACSTSYAHNYNKHIFVSFLVILDTPNSSVSTAIIALVVAIVVALAIGIFIACFLCKRKNGKTNKRGNNNGTVNAGFAERNSSPTNNGQELPEISGSVDPDGYEIPSNYAQLDVSRRDPNDGNYQSLIEESNPETETDSQQGPAVDISSNEWSDDYVIVLP